MDLATDSLDDVMATIVMAADELRATGLFGSERRVCDTCNLMREVAMADGTRICVCDGGCDELEQIGREDPACDKYEPRW
ncbi:MAG TPA: hypothetical protein IAA15_07810 [Candidatus Olsenella pullicola]|nr:hypothetical protein [Candidatus Olsenella pullicola]